MDVLATILEWSADKPDWQRDALRRLVTDGPLSDKDFDELTVLCESRQGLHEDVSFKPLDKSHIPAVQSRGEAVRLVQVSHQRGVNALAPGQSIPFGPQLTVVYGDNAAGKSGFTRILKSACQARGAEEILGNVMAEGAPPTPSVTISLTIGDNSAQTWPSDGAASDALARVSVFDSHSASVYLREKTDVAFRPFGLDLFDKLADACGQVQRRLERDRQALGPAAPMPQVPEGTTVHAFLLRVTSLTDPEKVRSLGHLSSEEAARAVLLDTQLKDLQTNDPAKSARELRIRAGRFRLASEQLGTISELLSKESVARLFEVQATVLARKAEVDSLREQAFSDSLVPGVGSTRWTSLWNAAREFSSAEAYRDHAFPHIDHDANCVLCHQSITHEVADRLRHFEEFASSQSEQDLRRATNEYDALRAPLVGMTSVTDVVRRSIEELQIDNAELASTIEQSLQDAETRTAQVISTLEQGEAEPENLLTYTSPKDGLDGIVKQLEERAGALEGERDQASIDALSKELRELTARRILGENMKTVLDEIERQKKYAAFGSCLDETKTTSITRKSSEITREVVTKQLSESFRNELVERLRFRHVEVQLGEAGGERGNLYHKLTFLRAPGVELDKVVSEGEARCLSIAAFFAELSTADDPSAILFDDPVSSLDHKWRRALAQRLVEEAATRQVIIFTHDIVFLLALHEHAEQLGIDLKDQHLRRTLAGAGVREERLPWAATKVNVRMGLLRELWQSAEKMFRNGDTADYEREAAHIYGLLRETWERALEEILLVGVVERFRESVQTKQINKLSEITEQDCKEFEAGMTKCSRWLPGHDQSGAANESVPEPDELKADLDCLDAWITRIRNR